MHIDCEHLQLTERLFRDVIRHLQARVARIQGSGHGMNADEVDLVSEEQTPQDQATVTALRLEICLYSLCVDWVQQQRAELQGREEDSKRHARENFFRLMTTMAQSELSRDAHCRSVHLVSQSLGSRPMTDAQLFTALEGTAERQLASLIAM